MIKQHSGHLSKSHSNELHQLSFNEKLETSLCLEKYAQDEIAGLKRELKRLASQLQAEKDAHLSLKQSPLRPYQSEISELKSMLTSFDEKFRSEVALIHEQYRAHYQDWKAKKKAQVADLRANYEHSLQKNVDLEALCKEL